MTPSLPPSAEHLVLVGMMGSGKTTLGRVLAARLNRPLFDSDAMIEERTGKTVAQIFAAQGEPTFRAEESRVLTQALASPTPAVIAAAGGSVLDPANRERMAQDGMVVWLRADPAILAGRVQAGDHRPLLAEDPRATLRRLDAIRRPLYAEIADLIIDVDKMSRKTMIDLVIEMLTQRELAS